MNEIKEKTIFSSKDFLFLKNEELDPKKSVFSIFPGLDFQITKIEESDKDYSYYFECIDNTFLKGINGLIKTENNHFKSISIICLDNEYLYSFKDKKAMIISLDNKNSPGEEKTFEDVFEIKEEKQNV